MNEYIDSSGRWHHIAQFNGRHNMLKSMVLLLSRLSQIIVISLPRQLAALTGLGLIQSNRH